MRQIIFILLLISLGSCVKKVSQTQRFYLIDIPVLKDSVNYPISPVTDEICQVEEVDVFGVYATNQIAFRQETHEIIYYAFHNWAVKPGEMLTLMINKHLQNASIFGAVSNRFWREVPDYQLQTTVYHLEMVQEKKQLSAHLDLEFNLIDNQTNEIVLTHKADRTRQLEANSMNLFASAISDLFYTELRAFTEKMKVDLQARKP